MAVGRLAGVRAQGAGAVFLRDFLVVLGTGAR
ncbi:hypothetical protein SAMN06272739_2026 [Blastococcus haudaquaticus]|uniref:Uncharacterized protein n=1 Tax=Blastococcus haudaquaticus TaxID=1938745 RepID=A0A286GT85_9ACTN|nr:hypothetical protein SAMN06272739_2026 [Blastococcus haudaquaticus]